MSVPRLLTVFLALQAGIAIAEPKPATLATVRVDRAVIPAEVTFHPQGQQPVSETNPLGETTLTKEGGWAFVSEWATGLTARPIAKGTVTADGIVLLAVTWSEPTSFGPWYLPEHRHTPRRLLKDGWVPVGRLEKTAEPAKGYYAILRREFKAGEEIAVRGLRYYPPLLISVPEERAEEIAARPRAGVDDLIAANQFWKFPQTLTQPVPTTDRHSAAFHLYDYDHEYGVGRGLLVQEIARQAVIMAARDGGLATRDEALREPLRTVAGKEEPTVPSLDLMVAVGNHGWIGITVMRRTEKARIALFDDLIEVPGGHDWRLYHTLWNCETLTREALHEAFEKSGLYDYKRPQTGYRPAQPGDAGLPPDVQEQLLRFNAAEQFLAVRRIHELIQEHGETWWLLAGLSRGYANLGSLTSHHWSRASKVYAARGLLYAERLQVVDGAGPWSRWHRAYAFALAGHHGLAQWDLDGADKRLAERPEAKLPEPGYIAALRAFIKGDGKTLATMSDDDAAENRPAAVTARYLDFVRVALGTDYDTFREVAERWIDAEPANHRVLMMLAHRSRDEQLREASLIAAERFPRELYDQARRAEPLPQGLALPDAPAGRDGPEPAAPAAGPDDPREIASRVRLLESLVAATDRDRAEPSLAAFARLIEDETLRHAQQRFYGEWYGERDALLETYRPVLDRHPYGRALWLDAMNIDARREAAKELAANYDFRYASTPSEAFRNNFSWYGEEAYDRLRPNHSTAVWLHLDAVLPDLVFSTDASNGFNAYARRRAAEALLTVAPNMPATINHNLHHNWLKVEPLAAEWEKRFQDEPTVLAALTSAYRLADRHDDAARVGKRLVEIAPSRASYQALAWVFYERSGLREGDDAQSDREACLEFYRKALEQTKDGGVTEVAVSANLAAALVEWERPEEALPHARNAAENGSAAGYEALSNALAQLERWEEAEEAAKQCSESSLGWSYIWLRFCAYYGRGDFHAAADALRAKIDSYPADFANNTIDEARLHYFYLTGQFEKAYEVLRRYHRRRDGNAHEVLIAIIADAMGDTNTRDSFFQQARTATYTDPNQALGRTHLIGQKRHLARLVDLILDTPKDQLPDPVKIEEIVRDAPGDEYRLMLYYFAGKLVGQRGHEEEGLAYLRKAAGGGIYSVYTVWVRHELRTLGVPFEENPVE